MAGFFAPNFSSKNVCFLSINYSQQFSAVIPNEVWLSLAKPLCHHDARSAIKRYQKFMHLEQTGELDEATLKEMKKPRCGNADVDESGDRVRRY